MTPEVTKKQVLVSDLIAALGGDLLGASGTAIRAIAPLEDAGADAISFLSNPKYEAQLATTQAACVIVSPKLADAAAARQGAGTVACCIVAPDPYLYFARLTQWWAANMRKPRATPAIHPTATVAADAVIGRDVEVGPHAVIESGAVLGDGVRIGAHTIVEQDARIGAHTRLAPHVVFGHDCVIGERSMLHSGVVIGADGFGFAPTKRSDGAPGVEWVKIEQLGAVRIGDGVEIGANTCVDRGALGDTVIADGVIIDNLVQIAHNVKIGKGTAIAVAPRSAPTASWPARRGSTDTSGSLTACRSARRPTSATASTSPAPTPACGPSRTPHRGRRTPPPCAGSMSCASACVPWKRRRHD